MDSFTLHASDPSIESSARQVWKLDGGVFCRANHLRKQMSSIPEILAVPVGNSTVLYGEKFVKRADDLK